jgi:hypothetical protein
MILEAVLEGDLEALLKAQGAVVDEGAKKALRRAAGGIAAGVRRRIKSAGFAGGGGKLAKAVRTKTVGKGADTEGLVVSKAIKRTGPLRPGGDVDLVQLFAQGTTIRAAGGGWLAIPTEYAPIAPGRGVRRRMTPKELMATGVKLAFLPAKGGKLVAVKREQGRNVVTHVLVRQVSLRPRYEFQGAIGPWVERFPALLAEEMEKAAAKRPVLARYE